MGVFERTCELRLVLNTLLRLVSGIDFVLTSIYCLLAFLPYTFFFLIKAPPYSWMPWFAPSGNPVLCSGKCSGGSKLAAARGLGETRAQISYRRGTAACRRRLPQPASIPARPRRQSNGLWLEPGKLASPDCLYAVAPSRRQTCRTEWSENGQPGYSEGLLFAAAVSVIYTAGSRMGLYSETGPWRFIGPTQSSRCGALSRISCWPS
jgi:hypothetical protein